MITHAVFQSGFSWPVIAAKWEGFRAYLGGHGGFDAVSADLQRRFKWLGALGAYHLLYVVKEPVLPFEEWRAAQGA